MCVCTGAGLACVITLQLSKIIQENYVLINILFAVLWTCSASLNRIWNNHKQILKQFLWIYNAVLKYGISLIVKFCLSHCKSSTFHFLSPCILCSTQTKLQCSNKCKTCHSIFERKITLEWQRMSCIYKPVQMFSPVLVWVKIWMCGVWVWVHSSSYN